MKLVFISMVTTPMSGVALRAAVAMATSRGSSTRPPCVTSKELKCSGWPSVQLDSPPSMRCR